MLGAMIMKALYGCLRDKQTNIRTNHKPNKKRDIKIKDKKLKLNVRLDCV